MKFAAATLAIACASLVLAAPARAGGDAFESAVGIARTEAILEHPAASLARYRDALAVAGGDATNVRIARFGIARMLGWLGRFDEAHAEYAELLATPLSDDDREIALDGNVRSLLALDRPMSAYRLVRGDTSIGNAHLALAAARAADESGHPEDARAILARHRIAIDGLAPGSRFQTEARALARDVASESVVGIGLTQAIARDSDGESSDETTVLIRDPLRSGDVLRFRGRRLALSGPMGNAQASNAYGASFSTRALDTVALSVAGDSAQYGAWHPTFFSGNVAYQPIDALRLTVAESASAVETQVAIADRVRSQTVEFGVTGRPDAGVTLEGSTYGTRFSDGNGRVGYFGRVSVDIPAVAGLSLALVTRGFADRETPGTGYFSPYHFREEHLLVSESARVRGWRLSADAGIGREKIAPGAASTTTLVGIGAHGPLSGCLRLDASADDTDSAAASASGYRRLAASFALSCAL